MKTGIKVLMLGWEFSPEISGGLGVATFGLCRALGELVDIHLLLPKINPAFKLPGIKLSGINNIDKTGIDEIFAHETSIPFPDLFSGNTIAFGPYTKIGTEEYVDKAFYDVYLNKVEPFKISELYGGDIFKKVFQYSRIAVQFALNKNFDIIHAHDWMTFLPAMALKTLTGKPLVLQIHSLEYDRRGEQCKNWVYDLEKRAMEFADKVIAVSKYSREIAINHYGIPESKINVVYNAVDPIINLHEPKKDRRQMVLFLGRIAEQKGPEYFIDAAFEVLKVLPDIHFVMAGDGDLKEEMIRRVAEKGMGTKFHFTGFVDRENLQILLAEADVYCMPGGREPFGLSALEAVQFGIPTIISKHAGVTEVLPGTMLIDFDDKNKLAEYIIALLNYPGLRKTVQSANTQSLKSISWENSAHDVINIYKTLLLQNKYLKLHT